MKIVTFNVNSVRVRAGILAEFLQRESPDVVALQETKCEDGVFPRAEFEALGYHVACDGQKTYNGVALLTREPLTRVKTGFGDPNMPDDKRIIGAEIQGIWVLNTYVPNGTKVGGDKWDYKMRWLERFREMIAPGLDRGLPIVWLGDINIAPEPIDVYDSAKVLGGVGHHPDEFARLKAITDLGLIDSFRKLHPEPGHYSYWDFFIKNAVDRGLGWRIDHIYVSPNLEPRVQRAWIDLEPRRKERPSDHTPVILELAD